MSVLGLVARPLTLPSMTNLRADPPVLDVPEPTEVSEPAEVVLSQASASPPRLALSWVDRLGAKAFLAPEEDLAGAVLEHTTELARALYETGREEARMRLLAKSLATARTQVSILEKLLGDLLVQRDAEGVKMISRALDGATRRMVALLAEHRQACNSDRRNVTVAVAHVNHINVLAGR